MRGGGGEGNSRFLTVGNLWFYACAMTTTKETRMANVPAANGRMISIDKVKVLMQERGITQEALQPALDGKEVLGPRLLAARKFAGLTQSQLAEKSGLSQQMISKLESGRSNETAGIVALALACGVRPEWLFNGNGSMRPPRPDKTVTLDIRCAACGTRGTVRITIQ